MAGELEAADDVGVDDVPGNAHREDVAEPLIEDEFRRCAAVDATDNGGKRPLAVARLVGLLEQVAVDAQVIDEARVAFPEYLERPRGRDAGLGLGRVGLHRGG